MWQFIKKIPSFIWRTFRIIREAIWNFILIIIVISLIGTIGGYSKAELKQSVLVLDIKGVIVDNLSSSNPLELWFTEFMGEDITARKENSIFELIDKINQAKNDVRITGLILSFGEFYGTNSANLQALGEAIKDFKKSDKPVFAYGDSLTQQDYYLASFADDIYITPHGNVDIHGFATSSIYFKSLLDSLGVNTHVFRVGTHKSAVEPYLRDDMSPEAREMTTRFLTGLWDNYLQTVAENRKMNKLDFFTDADSLIAELQIANGNLAKLAYEKKWVDALATRSKINDQLQYRYAFDQKDASPNFLSIYDYTIDHELSVNEKYPNIAVITVDGPIVDGLSGPGYAGADTIAEQIRQAEYAVEIEGMILRVNSPGGSVTAAEVILAQLEDFKKSGKPIVASFGGLAASGGYWISTAADYIVANENTLTGSIGIFGVIPTVEESLAKIGVFSNSVATTGFGAGAITESLPEQLKQMMQLSIEHGYSRFISLVSASRHLSSERVDKVAQGQVWIAKDALAHKLIDDIGNFDVALKKLSELTEIEEPVLKWYKTEPSFFEATIMQMNASMDNKLRSYIPQSLLPYVDKLTQHEALLSQVRPSIGGMKVFVLCEVCSVETQPTNPK